MKPTVLVIEDDPDIASLVCKNLEAAGFACQRAADGESGIVALEHKQPSLVVLDLGLPGMDGHEVTRRVRQHSAVPILMLTAMGEADDRIRGLEKGADDYLVKPFEPRELVLRINNILKRAPAPAEPPAEVKMGAVLFKAERGELSRDGRPIRLTDVEQALLAALARRPGQVLSREELIRLTGASGGGRAIDVQVTRLRRKIEDDPKLPRYLQTVRGKGYVLRPD